MIYRPSDTLKFGKNKGHTLDKIWKYEPTYITWLIANHESFSIAENEFRSLPIPTPFSVGAVSNTLEYKRIMQSDLNLLQKLTRTDSSNPQLCVDDIIKLELMGEKLKATSYWFSNEILDINIKKKNNISN